MQVHKGLSKKIEIPRSVPGLVTRQLLVMNFLDGTQITRLGDKVKNLSKKKRKLAMDRILNRVAEAYGRQLLYGGLFQADGHPGNILVMKGMYTCLFQLSARFSVSPNLVLHDYPGPMFVLHLLPSIVVTCYIHCFAAA